MSWFSRRAVPEDDYDLPKRPEPVAHEAFRRELEAMVAKFLPHGVDEATPHVLDRLIDRYTLIQIARLVKAWAIYQDELMPHLVRARADLAYEEVQWESRRRDLDELRIARDAAMRELAGAAAPPPATPPITPTTLQLPQE
jgi:hypothetical protein